MKSICLSFFMLCTVSAFSQNSTIEVSYAPVGIIVPVVKSENRLINNSKTDGVSQPSISLAVTKKIKANFYLKGEISYSSFQSELLFDYQRADRTRSVFNNLHKAQVISLAVLPEIRGKMKNFYATVNAGVLGYAIQNSSFANVNTSNDVREADFNKAGIGFANNGNIGVNFNKVAVFTGYTLAYYNPSGLQNSLFALGYWQTSFRVGVAYSL